MARFLGVFGSSGGVDGCRDTCMLFIKLVCVGFCYEFDFWRLKDSGELGCFVTVCILHELDFSLE